MPFIGCCLRIVLDTSGRFSTHIRLVRGHDLSGPRHVHSLFSGALRGLSGHVVLRGYPSVDGTAMRVALTALLGRNCVVGVNTNGGATCVHGASCRGSDES